MSLDALPLKKKLLLGFSFPVAAMLIIALVVNVNVNTMTSANKWVDHTHKVIAEAKAIQSSMIDMETGMRGFLVSGKEFFLEPYKNGQTFFDKAITDLQKTVDDNPPQVARLRHIQRMKEEWINNVVKPALSLRRDVSRGVASMDQVAAFIESGKGKAAMDAIRDDISTFVGIEQKLITQRSKDARAAAEMTILTLVICVVLGVGLALVAGFLITRNIQTLVGHEPAELAHISRRIADGDLTMTFRKTGDETGVYAAMLDMTDSLKTLITRISDTSASQQELIERLSSVTEQTTSNVNHQNEATDQVATGMEELSATSKEVAMGSSNTSESANEARGYVQSGNDQVTSVAQEIRDLSSNLSDTTDVINALSESAGNISTILDVIKSIADQTNLLALNAAIEAARAGEQGRGFAVVADEVRSLAQNTQNSTQEIESMIQQVQHGANESTQSMSLGRDKVRRLVEQTDQVTSAFEDIMSSVMKITELSTQMATAAQEQQYTSEDMSQRVVEIRTLSNQTEEGAQDINDSVQQMVKLSHSMNDEVRKFRV